MKKTLILDSNPETGLLHTLFFTLSGHEVTEVRSPAEALNRVLGGEQVFHHLVVSRYAPSLPFATFVETLREGGSAIPVIVFRRPENPPETTLPGVFWCFADDALEAVSIARTTSSSGVPLSLPPGVGVFRPLDLPR